MTCCWCLLPVSIYSRPWLPKHDSYSMLCKHSELNLNILLKDEEWKATIYRRISTLAVYGFCCKNHWFLTKPVLTPGHLFTFCWQCQLVFHQTPQAITNLKLAVWSVLKCLKSLTFSNKEKGELQASVGQLELSLCEALTSSQALAEPYLILSEPSALRQMRHILSLSLSVASLYILSFRLLRLCVICHYLVLTPYISRLTTILPVTRGCGG